MIEYNNIYTPSPSRKLLLDEVEKRGWTTRVCDPGEDIIWIVDNEGKSMLFRGSRPDITGANAVHIANNKALSYYFVQSLGVQVVPFLEVPDDESHLEFLRQHKKVVVKPDDQERSKGVTTNITDEAQLTAAIEKARQFTNNVIVQKQISGSYHRLIVIDGELRAAMNWKVTKLTGDGHSTLRQLIEEESKNPRRGNELHHDLTRLDPSAVKSKLNEENLDKIIPKGESIELSSNASHLRGEIVDVTEKVHPYYKKVAELISKEAGLFINGIDILTDDISEHDNEAPFPLIEINSMPGLKLVPRRIASELLDAAFKYA